MIFEPRWKSFIVRTNEPIFTPLQCKMVIEAGREEPKNIAAVGADSKGIKVEEWIPKQELHILVGYHLKKCQKCTKI